MSPDSHDGVVIGSAVYGGKVQDDVLQFVSENQSALSQRPLATFVVCKEINEPDCHLEQTLDVLPAEPVKVDFFEGYILFRRDFDEQEAVAKKWTNEILRKFTDDL